MGRAPCCDKANVKRGPWSPEEDDKLKSYIQEHGTGGNWIALPQKIGLKRCGKSCRLRWLNYLRPNIKHGGFTEEEDNIICSLYISIGSRWSVIAAQLPGRTDNDIKNYWNTRLKKKLLGKHRNNNKELQQARSKSSGFVVKKEINIGNGDNDNKGNYYSSSSSLVQENRITTTLHHHQQLYNWPHHHHHQMPIQLPPSSSPLLYNTNQQGPSFNDQDSIRKLLIKLGGRFNDDDDYYYQPTLNDDGLNNNNNNNLQFITNNAPQTTQQIYEEEQVVKVVHIGSSSSTNNCISNNHDIAQKFPETNDHYCADDDEGDAGLGMEFFYGEDLLTYTDNKIIAIGTSSSSSYTCNQSTNCWGESTTLITNPLSLPPPPLVANSSYKEETTPKECALQELNIISYPREH